MASFLLLFVFSAFAILSTAFWWFILRKVGSSSPGEEEAEMEYNGGSEKADHLCVLVHGLCGKPAHLKSVAKALRDEFSEDRVHILVVKSNAGYNTYDGVETGGERVCAEIEEELASIERKRRSNGGADNKKKSGRDDDGGDRQIKKLSVVGYSLGGLVARYAIGLLYARGALEGLECMNFTAFASLFLGTRSPLKGWANTLFNVLGARTLSASGHQLFGIDSFRGTGRPLVAVLADPASIFMAGLRRFKRRTLYANVVNDRTAVYYTTGISKTDPFADLEAVTPRYVPGYEDVVLDRDQPCSPPRGGGKVQAPPTASLRDAAHKYMTRVPLVLALSVLLPVGVVAYLANAGWQTVQSSRRRQLHEAGQGGVDVAPYRESPPLLKDLRQAVEGAYEEITAANAEEYLDHDGGDDDGAVDSSSGSGSGSDSDSQHGAGGDGGEDMMCKKKKEKTKKLTRSQSASHDRRVLRRERRLSAARAEPTLALAAYQFEAVDGLDSLGWRKYPVWIHDVGHSHAAIIVRMDKPSFHEGWVVLRHWVKEEFLL